MPSKSKSGQFPPLRMPNPTIADSGKVRLGDAAITGRFPMLRRPDDRISDSGKVRLGDAAISGRFPPRP